MKTKGWPERHPIGRSLRYEQVVDTILNDFTSSFGADGAVVVAPAAVVEVEAAAPACSSPFPVTEIRWPTCLSRSLPPDSFHIMGVFAPAAPVLPTVPAVVVAPAVVAAPAAVVVLDFPSSTRAFISM